MYPACGETFVVEQDEYKIEDSEQTGGNTHCNVGRGDEHIPGFGNGSLQCIDDAFLLQNTL